MNGKETGKCQLLKKKRTFLRLTSVGTLCFYYRPVTVVSFQVFVIMKVVVASLSVFLSGSFFSETAI